MYFFQNVINIRKLLIVVSFLIVILIIWNTYSFFQIFKKESVDTLKILMYYKNKNEHLQTVWNKEKNLKEVFS